MLERSKLDPRTHIYLETVSPGECHGQVYMAISPFCIKKAKMVPHQEKKIELQNLKLAMQIQFDSGNNMGLVLSGHTLLLCVKAKRGPK